ncbi:MAG TPA: VWA-like domain-containing protein, partial [Candidatus Paceibacterota bacterium]
GVDFRFNPEFVLSLTFPELTAVWAHEVAHIMAGHPWRKGNRDHQRCNVAGDYAINPMLVDAGFTLPKGALIDSAFYGKSMEEIYSMLPASDQQQGGNDANGEGDCGPGEFTAAPNEQQKQLEADWKNATIQAAQIAKAQGKLPAALKGLIAELVETKIDWRAALRKFIQQRAKCDYSWTIPNRRFIQSGLYLPALRSESLPPIIVAIDTSGSTRSVLKTFASELTAILDETRPEEMQVIYCDAQVQYQETYLPGENVKLRSDGGGGTSFVPVFEHVPSEGIEPACLIYLTDLEGTFPEHEPSYPVLWASTEKHVAPWGETIYIDPRDR